VVETEAAFILKIDAPGFDAADFHVSLLDGVLTLAAKHEAGAAHDAPEGARVLRRERAAAAFRRAFRLPAGVDADGIAAHYHAGVLELVLPKGAAPEPTKIPVTVAAEGAEAEAAAAEGAEAAAAEGAEADEAAAAEEPAAAEGAPAEEAAPAGDEWTKVEAKAEAGDA
jgi:HSP20 family protein